MPIVCNPIDRHTPGSSAVERLNEGPLGPQTIGCHGVRLPVRALRGISKRHSSTRVCGRVSLGSMTTYAAHQDTAMDELLCGGHCGILDRDGAPDHRTLFLRENAWLRNHLLNGNRRGARTSAI